MEAAIELRYPPQYLIGNISIVSLQKCSPHLSTESPVVEAVREAAPPVMITLSPTDVPSTQVLPKIKKKNLYFRVSCRHACRAGGERAGGAARHGAVHRKVPGSGVVLHVAVAPLCTDAVVVVHVGEVVATRPVVALQVASSSCIN